MKQNPYLVFSREALHRKLDQEHEMMMLAYVNNDLGGMSHHKERIKSITEAIHSL